MHSHVDQQSQVFLSSVFILIFSIFWQDWISLKKKMSSEDFVPLALSARDRSSFAYPTLKDRVPVIVCKIIDSLYRNRSSRPKLEQEEIKLCIEGMVSYPTQNWQESESLTLIRPIQCLVLYSSRQSLNRKRSSFALREW